VTAVRVMYFGTFQGSLPLRKLWRDMLRESRAEFPQAGEQGRSDASIRSDAFIRS